MQSRQVIEVSLGTILKVVLVGVVLVAFWVLREIVAVVLLSIVIASALEPAMHWLSERRIPRIVGVLSIYLLAFMLFLIIFYLMLPPLFSDVFDFVSRLPRYIDETFASNSAVFRVLPDLPLALKGTVRSTAISLEQSFVSSFDVVTRGVVSFGSTLFGGILSVVLLVVISFYLSVQEHGIENFLRIITPLEHESYILGLWERAQRKIGRWLQGQILLGVLVGVMVFLMLTILNVEHAMLLAALSAIFELIPIFGPIMAAIPAVAIASLQRPILGLVVAGLYILVQQIENHLIYPLVVRKTVGVPPLLVVLALVIGGKLGGFFGVILSVPIAAVLVEFINDLSARKYPKN